MPELSMAEALNAALEEALRSDPRAIAFEQDAERLLHGGKLTDGPRRGFDPDRVFRVPLAESAVISLGIGVAMQGWHPIVEIDRCSYGALCRILSDLASCRARGDGAYDVRLTLCVPSFGGAAAHEDQAYNPEALFAHTPGLKVVTPATPQGAFDLLLAAFHDPDPVLFLQPLCRYDDQGEVDLAATGQQLGRANLVRDGDQATLVSWGAMVDPCVRVADAAAAAGVSVQVLDLRSLIPLDEPSLMACASQTGRLIVVHDAPLTAGFGAEIAARVMERAWEDGLHLQAPVLRVAGMDVPYPGPSYQDVCRPNVNRVRETLVRILDAPVRDESLGRQRERAPVQGNGGAHPQLPAGEGEWLEVETHWPPRYMGQRFFRMAT